MNKNNEMTCDVCGTKNERVSSVTIDKMMCVRCANEYFQSMGTLPDEVKPKIEEVTFESIFGFGSLFDQINEISILK